MVERFDAEYFEAESFEVVEGLEVVECCDAECFRTIASSVSW